MELFEFVLYIYMILYKHHIHRDQIESFYFPCLFKKNDQFCSLWNKFQFASAVKNINVWQLHKSNEVN